MRRLALQIVMTGKDAMVLEMGRPIGVPGLQDGEPQQKKTPLRLPPSEPKAAVENVVRGCRRCRKAEDQEDNGP